MEWADLQSMLNAVYSLCFSAHSPIHPLACNTRLTTCTIQPTRRFRLSQTTSDCVAGLPASSQILVALWLFYAYYLCPTYSWLLAKRISGGWTSSLTRELHCKHRFTITILYPAREVLARLLSSPAITDSF